MDIVSRPVQLGQPHGIQLDCLVEMYGTIHGEIIGILCILLLRAKIRTTDAIILSMVIG